MSTTIILVFVAFAVYLIYNGAAMVLFGVPNSLSDTFYLYKNKKRWMRAFFPIMMTLMVALLMPAWLEISESSSLQFLAFLSAAGILFTGAAPAFKGDKMEKGVHSASAICAAVFALSWVIFVSKVWFVMFVWLAVVVLAALITKTWKRATVYWLETVAFMSTFTSIIIYFFK